MNPREFVQEIIDRYHKAREPVLPHDRIFRGESRSIASETEDIFARYLIERLPGCVIFINQTITTGTGAKRIRIKPDLVIVQQNTICAILDLKMDLGYSRKVFPEFWKTRDDQILDLRNKDFSLYQKKGAYREHLPPLRFLPSARLFFVLVSDQNIASSLLAPITLKKGKMRNSDLFILTRNLHPNTYEKSRKEAMAEIIVNESEFENLLEELKSSIF